jgi:hypothetical protein
MSEELLGRASNRFRSGAKMRYRQDNGAGPFFFLIGLALVMVWLTQQL